MIEKNWEAGNKKSDWKGTLIGESRNILAGGKV